MRAHLLLTQVPTKQTRQVFCVAVGAKCVSLLISSRKKPGKMAIKLSVGPKFNVMRKSSMPCLGGDSRQFRGCPAPSSLSKESALAGETHSPGN